MVSETEAPVQRILSVAACLAAGALALCWQTATRGGISRDLKAAAIFRYQPDTRAVNSWDPKAAAAYLDQRAAWWMGWQGASRDHQTFCISCHTALPYALSRPALRK